MSVHKQGTKWKTRWREGSSNRARTFTLRRDAVAWDREVARRRQLGPLATQQLTERHGPTLGWWIEHRWAPEHGVTLAASTRDRYSSAYSTHIAPTLDTVPLQEITVSRVRAWQAGLLEAGVSPVSIDKCRTLLSSILRHAAESEAIPANPMTLVRPPTAEQHDAVVPIAPATVERVRQAMLNTAVVSVRSRQRDAMVVAVLAYSGLRPGELRGLRWGDIGDQVINVQRGTNPDGTSKLIKTGQRRSVRLLAPLARDLREYRLAVGRPADSELLLTDDGGQPWTKRSWQIWRACRWGSACRAAGLEPVPTPYTLRHSFASLLLAEGHQPTYVARQLGHSLTMLLEVYAHLLDEFGDRERISAEDEIRKARRIAQAA